MADLLPSLGAVRLSTRLLPAPPAYVLIGMAAVGKSTIGAKIAAEHQLPFIDTDHLLCEAAGCSLEELLQRRGPEAFCDWEEKTVLSIDPAPAVIATGGSLIYRPRAVGHLRSFGILLWLDAPANDIVARHRQRDPRGLVWLPEHLGTMEELIEHRAGLYRQAADYQVMVSSLLGRVTAGSRA